MSKLQTKLDSIVELYEQAIVLARQEEREECAKVCDEEYNNYDEYDRERDGASFCADAIRARGGVKTDDETCPHCGAIADAEYPNKYYGCGTHINDPTHRFGTCYERQLAAKDAEIERLKKDATYWKKMAYAEDSSSEGEVK